MFTGLLTSMINASNHTKFVSLNNQECMTKSTLLIYVLYIVKDYVIVHLLLI